jgi:hypothetical protein
MAEHVRARALLPAALVLALAVAGPQLDDPSPCAPSDGPQFRCWLLREHGDG